MRLTVRDLRTFQESPTDGDIQVLKWTVICGVFALHSSLTKEDEDIGGPSGASTCVGHGALFSQSWGLNPGPVHMRQVLYH